MLHIRFHGKGNGRRWSLRERTGRQKTQSTHKTFNEPLNTRRRGGGEFVYSRRVDDMTALCRKERGEDAERPNP